MWFDSIWNTPLFGWILLTVLGGGLIMLILFWQRNKVDPVKEHLDYFCRCYARGEISREDLEELKRDLQDYKRKINPVKKRTMTPHV